MTCQPTEGWSSQRDNTTLIDEARSVRDGLRAYAILNLADPGPGSSDNREAATAVADYPSLEYLDTPIRRRKAFANAAGQGLSVLEVQPRDIKACYELDTLISSVFDMKETSFQSSEISSGDHTAQA